MQKPRHPYFEIRSLIDPLKLEIFRGLLILFAFAVGAIIVGAAAFFLFLRKAEAVAFLVAPLEIVSTEGLGAIEQSKPEMLVSYAETFLTSRTAIDYAASQVPGVAAAQIQKSLKVDTRPNSSLIEVSVVANKGGQAVALANAIIAKATELSKEARQEQLAKLDRSLTQQQGVIRNELTEVQAKIASRQTEMDLAAGRQKQDALARLLADYRGRIAQLRVSEDALKSMLATPAETLQGASLRQMEMEETSQQSSLSVMRNARVQAASKAATLLSRYGSNHPKVLEAQAELEKSTEIFNQLLEEQRGQLALQSKITKGSIDLLGDEMTSALSEWRTQSSANDVELAGLVAFQEARTRSYQAISNRLLEIRVCAGIDNPVFNVVSAPTVSNRLPLKPLLATLALFALGGIMLGAAYMAWILLRSPRESGFESEQHDEPLRAGSAP